MTQLIAKSSVYYGGKTHRAGAAFDATEAHAAVLLRTGKVARHVEEAEEMPAVQKIRRQYRRRDMRPES